jgi:hypothetical protein
MKTLKIRFIAFLVMAAALNSCSKDHNESYCFSSKYTEVTSVTGPSSTTVNTPITLDVNYIPLGTCGEFNRFTEGTTFPKEIKVLVDYPDCYCPPTDVTNTVPYTFTASTAGEYELRFTTSNPNTPIVKTITVTE